MKILRIGLAQCLQTADFECNAEKIFQFIDEAHQQDVQILCFPETQTVGYRCDVAEPDAPCPVEKLETLHQQVADKCGEYGLACILGTEWPHETDPLASKPYNTALVINEQGKILGVHHKNFLTPLDAVAYSAGSTFETFDLFGVVVGVVICFEGFRFAETTAACVENGAQLVFHPQNNTTRPNDWKIPVHHSMITTRAAENTVWFASCNCCYPEHQNCQSMIIAPDGVVKAQAELKQEELVVADIDIDEATHAMFKFDLEATAPLLFSDTVKKEEFESILPGESSD